MKTPKELLAGSPFEREFGEEIKITPENLLRAAKQGMDLDYIARNCLPSPFWARYLERVDSISAHCKVEVSHLIAQLIAEYEREVDNENHC